MHKIYIGFKANDWINCMEISDRTRGEFNAILSECNYRRR